MAGNASWVGRGGSRLSPRYVGPALFSVAMLPSRCAYLIDEGSHSGFRRAVQEASTRWGGMTEPIVAIDDGGLSPWSRQLINLADVEAVVNVDCSPAVAEQSADDLGLPLVALSQIDSPGSMCQWTCHPADLPGSGDRLSPALMIAQEGADLWQVAAAGDLTPEAASELEGHQFRPHRPTTADLVARAQMGGYTLLHRTLDYVGQIRQVNAPGSHPAVLAVVGDNDLTTCIAFWNVRALRSIGFRQAPFVILPGGELEYWLGIREAFQHLLVRPAEFRPDVVVLCQSGDLIDKAVAVLGLEPATGGKASSGHKFPTPPDRQAPFTFSSKIEIRQFVVFERDWGVSARAEAHIFEDGPSNIHAAGAPVPFAAAVKALLRIEGAPLDSLPRCREVAPLIHESAVWHRDSIQLPVTASPGQLSIDIALPTLAQAVNAILAGRTDSFELSDKGRLATGLAARTDPAFLLERGLYEVIQELTTPRSKHLLRELQSMRLAGAADTDLVELASVWGGRAERRVRHASELQGLLRGLDGLDALEKLSQAGWVRRGLEQSCSVCTLTSFVLLQSVVDDSVCPGCGSRVPYSRKDQMAAPSVCYQLDSLVDRASDQGVIPHLLAAAALQREARHSHILPGVNLTFAAPIIDGDPSRRAEIDLFGAIDGKIIGGEVKTSAAEFTDEQLRRDTALCVALGTDTYVLASVDKIDREQRSRAEEFCKERGLEFHLMGPEKLRPRT